MNEHNKENMLQRNRDYKKKMRTQSAGDLAKETLHTVQNDIEYDGALFEPINNQSDEGAFIFFFSNKKARLFYFDNTLSQCVLYLIVGPNIVPEDHLEAPRASDIDDLLDDEETRQYIGEGNFFCVALSSKLILVKVKFVNVV